MSLMLGCVAPHPPILIPEIGGGERSAVEQTSRALEKLAEVAAATGAETCVVISPHSFFPPDSFALNAESVLEGSFASFGAPAVRQSFVTDLRLVEEIAGLAAEAGLPALTITAEDGHRGVSTLDHGVLVPLYFLMARRKMDLVSLSISDRSYLDHYHLGRIVRAAAENTGKKIVFVASGDLSHRLTPGAPDGYSARGKVFDEEVRDLVEEGAFANLMFINHDLVNAAGECGLRSLIALGGALDGYTVSSEVLSYEGPFGVGYLVASVRPVARNKQRSYRATTRQTRQINPRSEIPPISLAKQAVETYVREGVVIGLPEFLEPCLSIRAGVFVCLKKDGVLRGCIGTTGPTQPSAAHEIVRNAISAAVDDFRFSPVRVDELAELVYSVDILEEPEKVPDASYLNPQIYGVIVTSGDKTGVLLPRLEGITSVERHLAIAREKAGVGEGEAVTMYRFKVQRYD